ncbi:MAG: hypothetical protein V7739_20160 [Motiliproteus sp.]
MLPNPAPWTLSKVVTRNGTTPGMSAMRSGSHCYYINDKYKPECEPEDIYLKNVRNGKSAYLEMQKEYLAAKPKYEEMIAQEQRENRSVNITGLTVIPVACSDSSEKYCWGLRAKIENLNESQLETADFKCRIIFDDSYVVFDSKARAEIKLLGMRQADAVLKSFTSVESSGWMIFAGEDQLFTTEFGYKSVTYTCETGSISFYNRGGSNRASNFLRGEMLKDFESLKAKIEKNL